VKKKDDFYSILDDFNGGNVAGFSRNVAVLLIGTFGAIFEALKSQ
jgi:hypothetical protein